uniref:Uncharacterized protein n=1 Tax=Trypanosoma vivax (strain Y486) TaxID=1055687 RepID=G0U5N7_TRYVY|nr:hypothetical protein, unlikely [Trypanosoma vivax Y486]
MHVSKGVWSERGMYSKSVEIQSTAMAALFVTIHQMIQNSVFFLFFLSFPAATTTATQKIKKIPYAPLPGIMHVMFASHHFCFVLLCFVCSYLYFICPYITHPTRPGPAPPHTQPQPQPQPQLQLPSYLFLTFISIKTFHYTSSLLLRVGDE